MNWPRRATWRLAEKKHSVKHAIPSDPDIKDACIKMALFGNIESATDRDHPSRRIRRGYGAVGATSDKTLGILHSNMTERQIEQFCRENSLNAKQKKRLLEIFAEARNNGFCFFINNAGNTSSETRLLVDYMAREN